MPDPFDFNDGRVPCDECGLTFPADEGTPVSRWRYKANVDFEGQSEHSRRHLVVCPRCLSRVRWRQRLLDWKDRWLLAVAILSLVGGAVVATLILLRPVGPARP